MSAWKHLERRVASILKGKRIVRPNYGVPSHDVEAIYSYIDKDRKPKRVKLKIDCKLRSGNMSKLMKTHTLAKKNAKNPPLILDYKKKEVYAAWEIRDTPKVLGAILSGDPWLLCTALCPFTKPNVVPKLATSSLAKVKEGYIDGPDELPVVALRQGQSSRIFLLVSLIDVREIVDGKSA